jgi:hypothetical protein
MWTRAMIKIDQTFFTGKLFAAESKVTFHVKF